ncbi:hypothetical protein [Phenylobacterium aquaticum]|uniref:hypothetical protein n=1 Tax=Phenylobacterium aquaticum TaxID=1763816 RepID=UPI0026F2DA63|nr:hypothetical protein [Phenylobacterium aquaticum]
MKYILDFTTQYGQFYLEDEHPEGNAASDSFWSDEAFADKLAVEKGILGVGIGNDEGIVKCTVEILSKKSNVLNFNDNSHVVEASLNLKSGKLLVIGCPIPDVELNVAIEPGEYRVRVYSNNLEKAYDENPEDTYQIELWKENYSDRVVLKRNLG